MASKARQKGMGFVMLLYVVGTLACGGLIAAQVFPTYLEYQAVLKAARKAKDSPTVLEVRKTFDKAAEVDNITSIAGKDLEVGKGPGDQVFVKFAYNKEIHLFANAYLVMKYTGDSRDK
jgi:hypothetical protein